MDSNLSTGREISRCPADASGRGKPREWIASGADGWHNDFTVVAVTVFQSKTSDRWSEQLTPWGMLDMALRGNRAQWWELYAAAKLDPAVRLLLRKMLPLADPDLSGGARLWLSLLDRFDAESQTPPS